MNVKRKGNEGERELVRVLQSFGLDAVRNDQMYCGGLENPDISCTIQGIPLHIECKRVERLNLTGAVAQAVRDANGKALPVVAHRSNRQPWLITIPLEQLAGILFGGGDKYELDSDHRTK